MKAHILFLGGTGARIYRALIHCMASGMYHDIVPNHLEICAYLIDPDPENGDGCRARNVANTYISIRQKCMLDQKSQPDCPLFSIPLQHKIIQIPNASYRGSSDSDDDDDIHLFLSALLGDNYNRMKDEMGLYLAMSSLDLSSIEQTLYPFDVVVVVGGTFGKTGYTGLAKLSNRIKQGLRSSTCRVAMVPVGPYFKNHMPKDGRVYNDTFFVRHSMLNMFLHEVLNRNNRKINTYNICLSDREVDTLRNADGGAGQQNQSHVVELCAAFAIFDLINKPWAEGLELSFDMSGFKSGNTIASDDFPYDMRQYLDSILCFSIWSRRFGKQMSFGLKETKQYASDFQVWLEEMTRHTIAFKPIDFSCDDLSKTFNWYKPIIEFGLFKTDPLDSKNLLKLKEREYQRLNTYLPEGLPEGYRHLVSEYTACIKAWKKFKDLCKSKTL